MPPINRHRLRLAMELRKMNAQQLSDATYAEGVYHPDDRVDQGRGITLPPIAESYISMLLSGKRNMARSPIMRDRLAEALRVPVDWIEDERPDPDGDDQRDRHDQRRRSGIVQNGRVR